MTRLITIVALCLMLGFSIASFAQGGSTTLTGLVTDPSGLPVVGAKIQATHGATGVVYSAETNDAGRYSLPNLPPGKYQLTAKKQGFERLIRSDVQMHVAETVAIDLALHVGSVD